MTIYTNLNTEHETIIIGSTYIKYWFDGLREYFIYDSH